MSACYKVGALLYRVRRIEADGVLGPDMQTGTVEACDGLTRYLRVRVHDNRERRWQTYEFNLYLCPWQATEYAAVKVCLDAKRDIEKRTECQLEGLRRKISKLVDACGAARRKGGKP